ncbi:MAG: hypothetical protein AB8G22_16690 [Saprospiraceae bacterium]
MKKIPLQMIASMLMGMAMLLISTVSYAQCETWVDSPTKDQAEEAHVLYRQFVKAEDYDQAFEHWKKAYELAPAADGGRSFHYSDGRKIYKAFLAKETDEEKKKEYKDTILKLYDQQAECYPEEAAFALGRKGFDMFYTLNSLYSENLAVLEQAMETGGNDIEYIVMDPAARIVVYQFKNELIDAEKARALNLKMNEIADYNVENNEKYGTQWKTAQEAMNGLFVEIEDQIFDCDYFKNKLLPKYKENPEDMDVIKFVYNKLKQQNCDAADVDLMELKTKYETKAAAINAAKQAEFEANNPGVMANKMYKAGDYPGAIAKYKEAIATETDTQKQASYYYSIASIQFRKLKSYGAAKQSALKAVTLRNNWGEPYMLIGDMYATSSRNCGDAWQQRLAVLAAMEKYSYAKSIDSSVTDDANKSLGRYRSSLPSKEEGFMRKVKEGQRVKVKCWIGETVKVRYQ